MLLQRFKYRVFYKRQWQQGIELSQYLLKLVQENVLEMQLGNEGQQLKEQKTLLQAIIATTPHKPGPFLFLAGVSNCLMADCPE